MRPRSDFVLAVGYGWLTTHVVAVFILAVRWLIAPSLLLACLVQWASAGDYVYRDGYYWYGGKAYSLRQVYSPTLYRYVWEYVLVKTTPATPAVTAATPDWRAKLLEIAATAKKYEASAKASATEHNEFLEAVEALGLNGALNTTPYTPRYANGGTLAAQFNSLFSTGYSPIAGQGSGVYGYGAGSPQYSFSQATANYPGVDLAKLYQSAVSLTQQAQDLGGAANANLMSTVQQEGANQSRVAEIIARAQAASAVIQAAGAGVPSPTSTTQTSVSLGPNVQSPANNAPTQSTSGASQADFDNYVSVAQANCVSCHNGSDSAKKGPVLDFQGYATTFSRQDQLLWIDRITTHDAAKRMPAGGSLSGAQVAAFTKFLKSE